MVADWFRSDSGGDLPAASAILDPSAAAAARV
jgi:hypothetical protein